MVAIARALSVFAFAGLGGAGRVGDGDDLAAQPKRKPKKSSDADADSNQSAPIEGGVRHCDRCQWNSDAKGSDGCFYPVGEDYNEHFDNYRPDKHVLAFNTSSPLGCAAQAKARQRFDSEPLELSDKWPDACIEAFHKPSATRQFRPVSTSATAEEVASIKKACDKPAKEMTGGVRNLILLRADTPRKDELFNWLKTTNARSILECYNLSATTATVKSVSATFPNLHDKFLKQVDGLEAASGPKGGHIQSGALIATGHVRAMIFFQSYATECHRCDIGSLVQVCNGYSVSDGGVMCAYDAVQGKAVMDVLQMEAARRGCKAAQDLESKVLMDGEFTVQTTADGAMNFEFVPDTDGRWADAQQALPPTQNFYEGALAFCDQCQIKDNKTSADGCYYPSDPDYDMNYKGAGKTVGFNTSNPDACREQGATRSRFDGSPLSISQAWSEDCVKAFYSVSATQPFGDGVETDSAATPAMLKQLNTSCGYTASEFVGNQDNLIVIATGVAHRQKLMKFLGSHKEASTILSCYGLSGSDRIVQVFEKQLPSLKGRFVPHPKSLPHADGPKGGDLQVASLLATGRVRALIYLSDYQKMCHRCDISSLMQICNGVMNSTDTPGQTLCAYDEAQIEVVLQELKKELLADKQCEAATRLLAADPAEKEEAKESK
eukprot:TRINITY_DN102742_c0_g1_i1.p1 TRINITY_DN102742_c0_g1~~TRINITY_DN102742_c0_g1_i1.p1  ORF type:complete len:696 (+),score=128.48 TRINITY_DN102742_c0_g1_i1:101-2089(+)